jgi:hypothetical protein
LSGALGIALTLLVVLAVQAAATPVRQRNELRQQWPAAGPVERPLDVEISARNYARRGQLLADRIMEMYSTDDVREADQWADEVVRFLSAHTSTAAARGFVTAADNVGQGGARGPYSKLVAQVNVLNEIAKQLAVEDSN